MHSLPTSQGLPKQVGFDEPAAYNSANSRAAPFGPGKPLVCIRVRYRPDLVNAHSLVANRLVLDKFAEAAKASWLVNGAVRHSWTFTPDAGKRLALLAESGSAWNQTWHVPTAPNPPTGREFIETAAKAFGVEPKYRVLSRPLIKIAGFFNSDIGESYEMLYQYGFEYLFDSTKFSTTSTSHPPPTERVSRDARRQIGDRRSSKCR